MAMRGRSHEELAIGCREAVPVSLSARGHDMQTFWVCGATGMPDKWESIILHIHADIITAVTIINGRDSNKNNSSSSNTVQTPCRCPSPPTRAICATKIVLYTFWFPISSGEKTCPGCRSPRKPE